MIEITNLEKSYGSLNVLKDISITFTKGKVYGIVGENGAGKTTFFRCIAGLEKYQGQILPSPLSLKQQLGYLPTEPYYFSKITGREYIHLICNARGHRGVDPDLKNIFDLPLNQYAITYSTGMKKKLALTAILMIPNEIYILDEPFNGVDIHSNRIISEIIHMIREAGKTLLLSSHIFSTLKETCDEIHQLKEGRFIRSTGKDGFDELEQAMTGTEIHEKIGRLKFG